MNKAITLLVVALLASCASAFLDKANGVANDYNAGLYRYRDQDYQGSVEKLTSAINEASSIAGESGDLDDENKDWWDRLEYNTNLYGRSLRGLAYVHLKKYNDASSDINWVVSYYNKNGCKRKDSMDACEDAIAGALTARGMMFLETKNYSQAIKDLDWLVKNSPRFGWRAYFARGVVYMESGDFATGYAHFDQLVKHDPSAANYAGRCAAGYGVYYESQSKKSGQDDSEAGRKKMARKLYELSADCRKALEIDPNNAWAKETLVKIDAARLFKRLDEEMDRLLQSWDDFFGGATKDKNKQQKSR